MSFCTVINCIDGRVQIPVSEYLRQRLGVLYVDVVTEPGPVRVFTDPEYADALRSMLWRVGLSREAHGSEVVAVVAHADCAGNPVGKEEQQRALLQSVERVSKEFPGMSVLGLWVDERWSVVEVLSRGPTVPAED
jgi:hypothetical protein